jgi:CheY-like chemotaxis protein
MKTLLIVEHDELTRRMLLEMLRVHDEWRLMAVADAPGLLRALSVFTPHLVILDVVADHVDGLEAYRLLREHPFSAGVPVLLVTANLVEAGVAPIAGMPAMIEMPVHRDELIQHVSAILAEKAAGSLCVKT